MELNLKLSFSEYLVASINLKFFFELSIFNAFFSNPLATIISRNILFNSCARGLEILKLHETTPPKALIGSQARADL